MRKRLRKKNREKVDRHIAYCKHFGLPIVLDESSKFKEKHAYRLRAMMEKRKTALVAYVHGVIVHDVDDDMYEVIQNALKRSAAPIDPPWWSELQGVKYVPIREVVKMGTPVRLRQDGLVEPCDEGDTAQIGNVARGGGI